MNIQETRRVEIIRGIHSGKKCVFHGFYQSGMIDEGLNPCALVEFEDGEYTYFDAEYVKFLPNEKSLTPNKDLAKCAGCKHYDFDKNVYTDECYSCSRYNADLFIKR